MKSYNLSGGAKRKRRWKMAVSLTLLVLVIGFLTYTLFAKDSEPEDSLKSTAQNSEASESQPNSVHGRYLFNGTAVLARAVEKLAGDDLSQPFSKMSTFNPAQYDAMTLDWECPSTEDIIPYQTQISNLLFNCHVKWLPEVKKNNFSIVSLANNHSGDLGQEAFLSTQKSLNAAGIQTYGNFDPAVKQDICEVIALPVRVQMPDRSEQEGALPVAFCAWHYFFRTPEPGEMEHMQQYAEIMPVFGFQHAGAEYVATAGVDQEQIARKMIDLGAEFAIGNSPHWVQNGEVYKGKPIFYSTGNFIFDQLDAETNRGLSIDVSINVPYSERVAKWLEIGEQCRAHADDCLNIAKTKGLTKYDFNLSYDLVGSKGGYTKVTEKADPSLQKAIEERVGWDSMKRELE